MKKTEIKGRLLIHTLMRIILEVIDIYQFKCKIFAKGIKQAFIQYPILEPLFLYGGYPRNDLRHKFLLATGSNVVDLGDVDFPKDLKIISLKGHFFDMIGIRTPDDTVYLADCISS